MPSFAARVAVERGSRLAVGNFPPDSALFVSFSSAEAVLPLRTPLVPAQGGPLWNFSRDTHLEERHLTLETPLLFRLFLRSPGPEAEDRELGTAGVDLSNLRRGFACIQGWYNLVDSQGECVGQLSLSVRPLTPAALPGPSPTPAPKRTDTPGLTAEHKELSRSILFGNLQEKMAGLDGLLREPQK